VKEIPGNGIEPLRPVQGDDRDIFAFFIQDCVIRHASLLFDFGFRNVDFGFVERNSVYYNIDRAKRYNKSAIQNPKSKIDPKI
jgi:hypothetical protein